jgi:hypothetical protein
VERCELCGAPVPPDHGHLLDVRSRRLSCACEPCSILFVHRGSSSLCRVGRRIRRLRDFQTSAAEWDGLRIPIGLAFFVNNSQEQRVVALYPGPAGATESLLALDSWRDIVDRNPILNELELDVEALLVNRIGSQSDHYLVPVDRCYELVGIIRAHWRGLAGGEDAWREIAAFFARLQEAENA